MNLTPAQQQLAHLSLETVMGASGRDPEFPEQVNNLAAQIWSEFIDEEISDLLTEEQLLRLGELLEDEDATEEDFSEFLNESVSGFDEMYQEKILDSKAITIEGRIKQLRTLADGEVDKLHLLDECEELIEDGEWLQVQDILATEFAEY
ncbi:MAG: hypothetical protein BroJett025_09710 [Patescibacteria group bacterium]|nr:MAG: hypothetical protein BroJett025_09710 [Patescibacteria group bacterium]